MSRQSKTIHSTEQRAANSSPKPSPYWGVRAHDFYRGLANKPIKIVALDGKHYGGTLVGVDQYDLVIRQANGLTILFPKHAVRYVQADTPDTTSS
jgi:sRNA-binding regulator protein Hfq